MPASSTNDFLTGAMDTLLSIHSSNTLLGALYTYTPSLSLSSLLSLSPKETAQLKISFKNNHPAPYALLTHTDPLSF